MQKQNSLAGQLALLRHIVENLHSAPSAPGNEITQVELEASPFMRAKLGPHGMSGIRKEAAKSYVNLADVLFSGSAIGRRGATFKDVSNVLGDVIIDNFLGRKADELIAGDLVFLEDALAKWFQQKSATHLLYVPCLLSPWPAPAFSIGPVNFIHVQDFIAQERTGKEASFDLTFEQMLQEMGTDSACWMATVEIANCTKERAWEIGELAVDLALVGLQLVVPLNNSEHMARLTARKYPRSRPTVSLSNGTVSTGLTNQMPGLTLGQGALQHLLAGKSAMVNAVGPRITAFARGNCSLPILEQAWADAAYWFHEGLAEPLDTIAVTKLETAIEVLLRAESTSGSKARVVRAIGVFYGLAPNGFINPESQITVEKFATGFVTDRSRILHGTWSTLVHSLRDSRPSLTMLVHGLLAKYVLELEQYSLISGAKDDVESFLTTIEMHQRATVPSTPERTI